MIRADRDRWLALALLLAALGLVYLALVHPLFTLPMRAADARIAELQERDARLRGLLAQRPQIERALATPEAQDGGSGFLAEATAELAAAALIQRLERVVADASPGGRGCAIVNRTPLGDDAGSGRYRRVTVQVRLRCGNAEMLAVLHALESGRPWLFVDALGITAQRYFAVPGAAQPQEGGLDVGFNLYGYLRPAAGAQP
ncbi:type II secretion system protein GspM [Thermomonas fusca]|uniref:General secretion pathway protein GspM n=1 Tax=Thermomonas fusca TaxID=215690 RepID=A0A5R9PBL6_9GAMM|nr:type II secretion system protein GspM [Thermomonas fusca]TLX20934.1 general secretion pathway protein GspM [Thermomonas fusca]